MKTFLSEQHATNRGKDLNGKQIQSHRRPLRTPKPDADLYAHSGQTQKSNVTSGFRRLELRKSLKRKPARLL